MDEFLPYEVIQKYNFVKINGIYQSYWYINNYMEGVAILDSMDKLVTSPNIFVNIHVEKVKEGEFLKKVASKLAISNSEKIQGPKEQIDIDILNKISQEARDIRYLVQVENEDIFEVDVFLSFIGKSEQELHDLEHIVQNELYTLGISIHPLNFKQINGHLACLPLLKSNNSLHSLTHRIFTTGSFTSIFPFYTQQLIEKNGIYVGKCYDKDCMLDFRKDENNNKNVLVLGSSGAGKSFFVKSMVLQYLYKGVKQVVLDPEQEYLHIAEDLGQRIVTKETFNIMEFSEDFVLKYPKSFLDVKISYIAHVLELDDIFNSVEKVDAIKKIIEKLYNEKGISRKQETLYAFEDEGVVYSKRRYIKPSRFPVISELEKELTDIKLSKTEKHKIIQNIQYYACKPDKCDWQDLTVFNLNNKDEKYIMAVIENLSEYYLPNYMLYIDEMWQLISCVKNEKVALKIADMFKTIRKQGAGIVAITQDIADVFTYDNGSFGKSILNNAFIRIFFKMEYLDIDYLKSIVSTDMDFYTKLKSLKRGSALIDYGGSLVQVDVEALPMIKNQILGGDV